MKESVKLGGLVSGQGGQYRARDTHSTCRTPESSWICMCCGTISLVPRTHASIQMNVTEVDKVTGRFNSQFKTSICRAIRRMGESDDSILQLAKADDIISKNF